MQTDTKEARMEEHIVDYRDRGRYNLNWRSKRSFYLSYFSGRETKGAGYAALYKAAVKAGCNNTSMQNRFHV